MLLEENLVHEVEKYFKNYLKKITLDHISLKYNLL